MIPVFNPILKNIDIKAAYQTIKRGEISGTFATSIASLEKILQSLIKQNIQLAFQVEQQLFT